MFSVIRGRILPAVPILAIFALATGFSPPHKFSSRQPTLQVNEAPRNSEGILLLAHGGKPDWDAAVEVVAQELRTQTPTEVAFGMADRSAIQRAIDRLSDQGVTSVVAVPLFISSYSVVITSTEYLLGLRETAPPELQMLARMVHRMAAHPTDHHEAALGTKPVDGHLPIRMVPAFDHHAIIGDILRDRAEDMSQSPEKEAVILVAHGPNDSEANVKWLANMAILGQHIEPSGFQRVEYMTVRDDADASVQAQATAELRHRITLARAQGLVPLVVPHVLSYGGIEQGIHKRLAGLEYRMASSGLLPDPRIVAWVEAVVSGQ